MPTIDQNRIILFAQENALVHADLERSLAQCLELASDPLLFEQMLQKCSLQKNYIPIEALITCCDWHGSQELLLRTIPPFDLNVPQSISDALYEALYALCEDDEFDLYLGEVTSLSAGAAKLLAQYQNYLGLEGLADLSDAAAQELAQHQSYLNLSGLTSLSDAAAQALSRHQGDLNLGSLTSLSDATARALAQHKGYLCLHGVSSLSDVAAQSLAQHQGKLDLPSGLMALVESYATRD
jgi:hypothetical protein